MSPTSRRLWESPQRPAENGPAPSPTSTPSSCTCFKTPVKRHLSPKQVGRHSSREQKLGTNGVLSKQLFPIAIPFPEWPYYYYYVCSLIRLRHINISNVQITNTSIWGNQLPSDCHPRWITICQGWGVLRTRNCNMKSQEGRHLIKITCRSEAAPRWFKLSCSWEQCLTSY